MLYRKVTVTLIFLCQILAMVSMAQETPGCNFVKPYPQKKISCISELQTLRSTHGTFFSGGNLTVSKPISRVIFLGVGAEYASCHFHEDNRAKLRRLRFLPLMIDSKFMFNKTGIIIPYLQFSEGVSFIRYKKEDEDIEKKSYKVSETGNYSYLGIGTIINISKNCFPTIGIGLKGFHMSKNVLDVNPHGLSFRIGYMVRPGAVLNNFG